MTLSLIVRGGRALVRQSMYLLVGVMMGRCLFVDTRVDRLLDFEVQRRSHESQPVNARVIWLYLRVK